MTPHTFATAPMPLTTPPGPRAGATAARHHQRQALFLPISQAALAAPVAPCTLRTAGTGFSTDAARQPLPTDGDAIAGIDRLAVREVGGR